MGVFVLFDEEEAYANSFAEYINVKKSLPYEMYVFTVQEVALEFFKENYVEVLLTSSVAIQEAANEFNVKTVILLSEANKVMEDQDAMSIYKYQSMEAIVREIIFYSRHGEEMGDNYLGDINLLGVYSPFPVRGKTDFAITLGQILASNGRTLYINLEEYSGIGKVTGQDYDSDLGDLMYFFRQNSEGISAKVKAVTHQIHNLDFVPPLVYAPDLRNLETTEWIRLIKEVVKICGYENAVVEFGNMIQDPVLFMGCCKVTYMPIPKDAITRLRLEEFDEYILKTGQEDLRQCIVPVNLPKYDGVAPGGGYEGLAWGKLGDFCRKLVLSYDRS